MLPPHIDLHNLVSPSVPNYSVEYWPGQCFCRILYCYSEADLLDVKFSSACFHDGNIFNVFTSNVLLEHGGCFETLMVRV